MVHLFATGGHVGLLATVDYGDIAAETLGGACGIHRHIATTDDGHTATQIDGGVVGFVVAVHKVGAGEQLVGRDYTNECFASNAHKLRQAGPAGNIDGGVAMAVEEFVDGDTLADNDVGLDFDTQTAQVVNFGFDDFLFG